MAQDSAIEWTDHTFNPWIGCTKVGPGCDHCYAEALMDKRHHRVEWGGARSRTGPATWAMPRRWERDSSTFFLKHRRRQRVFCSSLADVFDNHKSILPEWREDLAALILATPSLDWLLLTKRIGNALDMLIAMFPNGVPENVRVGATIVNQDEWDRDRRKIAQVRVACHLKPFLSMEPLLGLVNLETDPAWKRYIGWVIVGGESGRQARTMDPGWVIDLHDQCERGQVPFLFKQWGEHLPDVIGKEDPRSLTLPIGHVIYKRVGKKVAGRRLFGVEHNGFPA